MTLSIDELRRMQDSVGRGLTRAATWRQEQLQRLSELLDQHEQEVLEALAADLGKPPTEAFFEIVALRQELKLAQRQLRRWMRPRRVSVPLAQRPGRADVIPEPLGCVLIIGPWNYPFSLTLQPLISALAAACGSAMASFQPAPTAVRKLVTISALAAANSVFTITAFP